MNIEGAVSINVKFLNGASATFYAEPERCLDRAATLVHACEWIAIYANDAADSEFFLDCDDR